MGDLDNPSAKPQREDKFFDFDVARGDFVQNKLQQDRV
jgi:hypothetical protein